MSFREYEIRNKPLFASMKRARESLLKPHKNICSADDFFAYLESNYATEKDFIEFVTFYDYVNQADGFHYNIAYIYTAPSLKVRDLIFAQREQITKDTGWYPMVSGSRANFTTFKVADSYKYWNIATHKPPYVHLGKPLSIRNVAEDISSTAILLRCENGNILLDTGFGIEREVIGLLDFVFLSHFHKDHSAGIFNLLKEKEIPVVLSDITLGYLLNLKSIDDDDKKLLLKNAVLIESIKDRSYICNTIEFFNSYHCPGAYGLKYKYYNNTLIYPGDLCLTNGFFEYSNTLKEVIGDNNGNVSIITDCALVPRGDFAITDRNVDAIFDEVVKSHNNPIFVSRSSETLFNIYMCLFKLSIDKHMDWLFVVTDELFDMLKNILRTWLMSKHEGDLFVKHIVKKSSINYAETQRLYTMSTSEQFAEYKNKKLVFLLTQGEIDKAVEIFNAHEMDLYITGPLAASKELQERMLSCNFANIHNLMSPDWSFHSDKDAIVDFINNYEKDNIKFFLFHAFPKVLKKFSNEFCDEKKANIEIVSKTESKL